MNVRKKNVIIVIGLVLIVIAIGILSFMKIAKSSTATGSIMKEEIEAVGYEIVKMDNQVAELPTKAIFTENGKKLVFVSKDGKLEKREIKIDDKANKNQTNKAVTMINSGIENTEIVVYDSTKPLVAGGKCPTLVIKDGTAQDKLADVEP